MSYYANTISQNLVSIRVVSTPKKDTPQNTIQQPTTMYGVNKVAGELLCQYYFTKFGVDEVIQYVKQLLIAGQIILIQAILVKRGFNPKYDLAGMTELMLKAIEEKNKINKV